jgi:hypothetical protein
MFSWLKVIKNAADGSRIGTQAVGFWRQSFSEVAAKEGGALPNDISFWRKVADQFIVKLRCKPEFREVNPGSYDTRCAGYLTILEERILGWGAGQFSQSDLERIGEFIAFAVPRGPEEAIVVDPDRASLIYDFLPRGWVDGAGLPLEKFDALYLKTMGKPRVRRSISWSVDEETGRYYETVKSGNAHLLIKNVLMQRRKGVAHLTVGGERRMLKHEPMMHEPVEKLPWPLSMTQPHDVELVVYNLEGEELKPNKRFSREQIDAAIREFLAGSKAGDDIQLNAG